MAGTPSRSIWALGFSIQNEIKEKNVRQTKSCFLMMTLVLSSLLFFQGCSNGKTPEPVNDAKIHGTVTLNEKPIGPIALVLYSDHFGRIGEVQVDDKGTIQMESPVPSGGYMIALGKPREGSIPSGIPDAYFVETSSNLHVVLAKGDNELNLKLTK